MGSSCLLEKCDRREVVAGNAPSLKDWVIEVWHRAGRSMRVILVHIGGQCTVTESISADVQISGWGGRNPSGMMPFFGLPTQRANLGHSWGPFSSQATSG